MVVHPDNIEGSQVLRELRAPRLQEQLRNEEPDEVEKELQAKRKDAEAYTEVMSKSSKLDADFKCLDVYCGASSP